jgi:hypothetical protein
MGARETWGGDQRRGSVAVQGRVLEVGAKLTCGAGLAARGEREGSAGGPVRRNWAARGPEVERAAAGRKEKEKLGPRGGKVGCVR